MNLLVFLDFDGVLHGSITPFFSQLEIVEEAITSINGYVVISSDWRLSHGLEDLKKYFSPEFKNRIIGKNPSIDLASRYLECTEFLSMSNLVNTNWIAIDDRQDLFPEHMPNLLLTDPNTGFVIKDTERLKNQVKLLQAETMLI